MVTDQPEIGGPDLHDWIGRSIREEDVLSPFPASGLAATLDRLQVPAIGDVLPPLWHWLYFKQLALQSQLGVDGHPQRGNFLPPITLPRRMWAGSRIHFVRPLILGEHISRETSISNIAAKSGGQGKLVVVTLRHVVSDRDGVAVEEDQDLVYREAPPSAKSERPVVPKPDLGKMEWESHCLADTIMLFRYSALTFNAHRIHYDRDYAIQEEAYPALVVQGPLAATLLLDHFIRETGQRPRAFHFRGVSPLFDGERLTFCGRFNEAVNKYELWTLGQDGRIAQIATVTI